MAPLVPSIVEELMNKIALGISNRGNDWAAESAMIANNDCTNKNAISFLPYLQTAHLISLEISRELPRETKYHQDWKVSLSTSCKVARNPGLSSLLLISCNKYLSTFCKVFSSPGQSHLVLISCIKYQSFHKQGDKQAQLWGDRFLCLSRYH